MARLASILSILVFEVLALYAFFFGVAGVSPGEVAPVTIVVGILAVVFGVRLVRLGYELTHRGGDPILRAERNKARERRGF